jgi:UDP-N-acetylmuramyl pentapeptide phosphotransferase/UDP-N-acetylglucosamine-1-phosphate transferase
MILILGVLLAASSAGFLVHNWPPARIFMGDVGSAFLGFVFATLPSMLQLPSSRPAAIGFLVVWPFVFDTAFTFLRRLRRKESVFSAHRSHLYQRLVIAGWSHVTVTLLYSTLAIAGSMAAIVIPRAETAVFAALVPGIGLWLVVVAVESSTKSTFTED